MIRPAGAALLLAVLLAAPAQGAVELADYRARLERIDALIGRGEREAAARAAEALLREEIRWRGETLAPDPSVLQPIADEDEAVRGPLQKLIAALPRDAGEHAEAPGADRAALEALRAQQAEREIGKGGALPGSPLKKLSFIEQVWRWIETAASWLRERLRDLWQWLKKWLPRRSLTAGGGSGLNTAVFILVGAIVVVVIALAIRAARQPPTQPLPARALARGPDRDADPLSRSADEWERRALALAAEGRAREAIRAWYHALLVVSFRSGVLHHRRGRTNREYARSLAEDVPWRATFVELTGRFDLEWYGRAESTREALDRFAGEAQRILSALGRPA